MSYNGLKIDFQHLDENSVTTIMKSLDQTNKFDGYKLFVKEFNFAKKCQSQVCFSLFSKLVRHI
jgi:hypothetical protein